MKCKCYKFLHLNIQTKKQAEAVIRGSFMVLKEMKGDARVISYVVANLDGILEDRRSRVKLFSNV